MNQPALKQTFPVRDRLLGEGQPPYIIAEMACAHDGDLTKAKQLIDAAAEAGVDAIQLQLFSAEEQVAPHHSLYDLLRQLEFSEADWASLFEHARQQDLTLFAFTYDPPKLKLALDLGIDGIKLSSADLSNPEMLAMAASSDLPITLGTGASTLEEIQAALEQVQSQGGSQVVLMHGVQNFPTTLPNANLRRIQLLQRVFQLPVGYQDHTEADLDISKVIDLVAVGMGACIVEKHITLSRAAKGTDYQAALEPQELQHYVRYVREASSALGTDQLTGLTESDRRYRQFQKKSIVAAQTIPSGKVLTRELVKFLRSDATSGLPPNHLDQLLGKRVVREIAPFEHICAADVTE